MIDRLSREESVSSDVLMQIWPPTSAEDMQTSPTTHGSDVLGGCRVVFCVAECRRGEPAAVSMATKLSVS